MPRFIDRIIAIGIRFVPARSTIAIHGFGDDEENALRIAHAAVAARSAGTRVYLLSLNPTRSQKLYRIANRQNAALAAEPLFVAKNSVRGLWIFLTSRVVFYTHGLFGSPTPGRRRIHVLLGHGHGPKSATPNGIRFQYLASLATTNSSTWGLQVIRDLGITAEGSAVITGNPREDAFDEKADRGRLAALGLDPGRPVIAWLPTYRVSDHATYGGWADGERLDTMPEYRASLRELADLCAANGVTLVTKSHVLDAQGVSDSWGIPSITTEGLMDAGLSFYQFLQLTDGLVSDFSSVWVDYLSAGRSIGLLLHDVDSYGDSRGLNEPSILAVAADLELVDHRRRADFVAAVAAGSVWRGSEQADVREAIGFPILRERSAAVIDAVASVGVARGVCLPFGLR